MDVIGAEECRTAGEESRRQLIILIIHLEIYSCDHCNRICIHKRK